MKNRRKKLKALRKKLVSAKGSRARVTEKGLLELIDIFIDEIDQLERAAEEERNILNDIDPLGQG